MQFVLDFMPDCGDVSAGLFDPASKSAAIAGLTICCALMVLLLFQNETNDIVPFNYGRKTGKMS
ncbi:MAG: hypothetical protein R2854_26900 [Caldilineaceae bacterium]